MQMYASSSCPLCFTKKKITRKSDYDSINKLLNIRKQKYFYSVVSISLENVCFPSKIYLQVNWQTAINSSYIRE